MIMIVNFATQLKQEKKQYHKKARVVKKLRGKAISKGRFENTEKKEAKTLVHNYGNIMCICT